MHSSGMVEETGIPRENKWHYSGRAKLGVYVCVLCVCWGGKVELYFCYIFKKQTLQQDLQLIKPSRDDVLMW